MSTKQMDEIMIRWIRDGSFRIQMRHSPEETLAGYDLTDVERSRWLRLRKRPATANGFSGELAGH